MTGIRTLQNRWCSLSRVYVERRNAKDTSGATVELKNGLRVQADSHGQSAAVFGLVYLFARHRADATHPPLG
jgi:hypothetical protein